MSAASCCRPVGLPASESVRGSYTSVATAMLVSGRRAYSDCTLRLCVTARGGLVTGGKAPSLRAPWESIWCSARTMVPCGADAILASTFGRMLFVRPEERADLPEMWICSAAEASEVVAHADASATAGGAGGAQRMQQVDMPEEILGLPGCQGGFMGHECGRRDKVMAPVGSRMSCDGCRGADVQVLGMQSSQPQVMSRASREHK